MSCTLSKHVCGTCWTYFLCKFVQTGVTAAKLGLTNSVRSKTFGSIILCCHGHSPSYRPSHQPVVPPMHTPFQTYTSLVQFLESFHLILQISENIKMKTNAISEQILSFFFSWSFPQPVPSRLNLTRSVQASCAGGTKKNKNHPSYIRLSPFRDEQGALQCTFFLLVRRFFLKCNLQTYKYFVPVNAHASFTIKTLELHIRRQWQSYPVRPHL